MKIALVRPNYHTHLITPQLGLGYLSSYLQSQGMETEIIDGLNRELSPEQVVEKCRDFPGVGLTCLTDYFPDVVALSKMLKRGGKIVIIGGPHATALPEMTLRPSEADYVVVGEGEITTWELLKSIEAGHDSGKIPGVFCRGGGEVIPRGFILNIDELPFPDWEKMDPRHYQKAPHGAFIKHFPVAPVVSTRGCPFECSFCASPTLWGKRIRFRSPENIVDEIEYLVNRFQVKEIHFEDDNLTLKRSHIQSICELLISRKLQISWAAPNGVRVDTLDRELLALMKKSGCYMLAFGLESGNQAILDRVRKRTDLSTIRKVIGEAGRLGIITQGFFIFGLPGETEETISETIKFAKRSGLDRAQFLLLDVLPGSRLWEELKGEYKIKLSRRSYQEISWCPSTVSREVLSRAPGRAFRSFFFRPKQLYRLLRMMRPAQFKYIIRRIRDFDIF